MGTSNWLIYTHTDTRADTLMQAMTIPEGQNWPRVKILSTKLLYFESNFTDCYSNSTTPNQMFSLLKFGTLFPARRVGPVWLVAGLFPQQACGLQGPKTCKPLSCYLLSFGSVASVSLRDFLCLADPFHLETSGDNTILIKALDLKFVNWGHQNWQSSHASQYTSTVSWLCHFAAGVSGMRQCPCFT